MDPVSAPAVTLTISMDQAGRINVSGPVENTMLCIGLLEMGKLAVIDFAKQKERRIMEVPPGTTVKPFPHG